MTETEEKKKKSIAPYIPLIIVLIVLLVLITLLLLQKYSKRAHKSMNAAIVSMTDSSGSRPLCKKIPLWAQHKRCRGTISRLAGAAATIQTDISDDASRNLATLKRWWWS
jgi:hypothetical protein